MVLIERTLPMKDFIYMDTDFLDSYLRKSTMGKSYNLTNEKTELESSVLESLSECTNPDFTGLLQKPRGFCAGSDFTAIGGGEEN